MFSYCRDMRAKLLCRLDGPVVRRIDGLSRSSRDKSLPKSSCLTLAPSHSSCIALWILALMISKFLLEFSQNSRRIRVYCLPFLRLTVETYFVEAWLHYGRVGNFPITTIEAVIQNHPLAG